MLTVKALSMSMLFTGGFCLASETDPFHNVGTLGGLAVVTTAFTAMLKFILGRNAKLQEKIADRLDELTVVIAFQGKQLSAHDAQVRGVNPSTGANKDEQHRLASEEWRKLNASFDEVIRLVRERK